MKVFLLVLFWGVLAAIVLFGTLSGFDPSYMSMHGWIALSLGTVLSLVVGAGLMALVFHSARRGYDDRVDTHLPPDPQ